MEESEFNGWQRVLLFILPYLIIVGGFQLLGMLVAGQDISINELEEETTWQRVIVVVFGFTGLLMLISLFMKYVDKKPLLDLGLRFKNNGKDIVYGILTGLFVMGTGYGILILFDQLKFMKMDFVGMELLLTLVLYLIVSFSEEILLRGYVLRNFMKSMNNGLALLLSAILFSIMHSPNPNMTYVGYANLFLAGIILGLPYVYSKNLWFPIAFHFSWNFFQSLFGFNVSGIDSYSWIEFSFNESNSINGGDFGFEGSVMSIFFQIGLILILYFLYSKKNKKDDLAEIRV